MVSLQECSKLAWKQHRECMCWNQDAPLWGCRKQANKLPAQMQHRDRAEAPGMLEWIEQE